MITRIGLHAVRLGHVMSDLSGLMQGERVSIIYSEPPWRQVNLKYWATR